MGVNQDCIGRYVSDDSELESIFWDFSTGKTAAEKWRKVSLRTRFNPTFQLSVLKSRLLTFISPIPLLKPSQLSLLNFSTLTAQLLFINLSPSQLFISFSNFFLECYMIPSLNIFLFYYLF